MKSMKLLLTGLLFTLFIMTVTLPIQAEEYDRVAIYFKEATCIVCAELAGYPDGPGGRYVEDQDYIKKISDQGIEVITIDVLEDDIPTTLPSNVVIEDTTEATNPDLFTAFNVAYGIDQNEAAVPIIFVGNQYFIGMNNIIDAYNDNTIYNLSDENLLAVTVVEGQTFNDITGIAGFVTVLFAGFLDGFNPCAIAMLLLFVSLLGFNENKRVLILVSIVYISALFISYFLIGTFLLNFLIRFSREALVINRIISWFVALLCSFLFLFNLYDYIVTKNQEYGKVKNQLPKWIQKYNKKLIKKFTSVMNDPENKKGLIGVLGLTFLLGILLSVTELICTGQIYLGIIYGIHYLESFYAYIALLSYNIMFVLPLIAIAVIAIKGKGITSTSNWIREHLHIIKFANAMLFLVIALYYFSRIFNIF